MSGPSNGGWDQGVAVGQLQKQLSNAIIYIMICLIN